MARKLVNIDDIRIKELTYDITKIVASKTLSTEYLRQACLELEKYGNQITGELVYDLNAYFKKIDGRPLKVPRNWWQHLKLSHAPKWFVKKWPVRFTVYTPQALFVHEKVNPGEYTRGGVLYRFEDMRGGQNILYRDLTSGEKLYEAFGMLWTVANVLREVSQNTKDGVSQFAKGYEDRIRNLLLDLEAPSYMLNDTTQKMTDEKP